VCDGKVIFHLWNKNCYPTELNYKNVYGILTVFSRINQSINQSVNQSSWVLLTCDQKLTNSQFSPTHTRTHNKQKR